jgi:hypothetical protein
MKDALGHGSDAKMSSAEAKAFMARPFYHGTARTNLAFAVNRTPGTGTGTPVAYFSADPKDADNYARMDAEIDAGTPRTLRANLSVRNPVVIDNREMQDLHSAPDRVNQLRAQGYDAAVGRGNQNEIAVFNAPVAAHQVRVNMIGRKT